MNTFQFFRIEYRGYSDHSFSADMRKQHNLGPSPTGHACDFISLAEAIRAANILHIKGDLDHRILEMTAH